jgi:cytochrome c-type biogenesis protein CcmH/NrfG
MLTSAPAPAVPELLSLLAAARKHLEQKNLLVAAKAYFEITRLHPDCLEAYCQLAVVLSETNFLPEAAACIQRAIQLHPRQPRLRLFHGGILKKLGHFREAAECCRQEIQIDPANADAHYNLGLALQNLDESAAAIAAFQNALRLRPGYVDALLNLGFIWRQNLHTAEALNCFQEAVHREPNHPEAHWELGTTWLSLGRFEAGWPEYEWRWQLKNFTTPAAQFPQPRWDGSDLNGRRILLHCEQGYGDIIQFARYAALVAGRGGKVILGCPEPLRLLLNTVPGVSEVTTKPGAIPFDVHAPLMSLPAIFGTTLATVPAAIPYLTAPSHPPETKAPTGPGLKVGIVWAGDPTHKNDRRRSAPLEHFLPLIQHPGILCHSLQVGKRTADLARPEFAGKIIELGGGFRDFSDTARAVAEMDLILTVDTAVAHLAGALGKPVWVLLPFEAEWRWMLQREDSPWYPTLRLFRQPAPGDWRHVFERVLAALPNHTRSETVR